MSFHEKKAKKKKILTSNLHVLLAPRSRYLQTFLRYTNFSDRIMKKRTQNTATSGETIPPSNSQLYRF